jgi:CRISPR-associated protein Cas5d
MKVYEVDFRGDFACFSLPALPERYSSACPMHSHARGMMDAIFLKPEQFRWQIDKVEILNPVSYIALRRNEVKDVVNLVAVKKWMSGSEPVKPIFADGDKAYTGSDEKGRTQRQTMALKNVRYRIHAHIEPWKSKSQLTSLERQFERRIKSGKCHTQPVFGVREFPAFFRLASSCEDFPDPVPFSQDLGWMVYDVFDLSNPGTSNSGPAISVFNAKIENGILEFPPYDDERVRRVEGAINA